MKRVGNRGDRRRVGGARGLGVALVVSMFFASGCATTAADLPRLEREAREAVEAGRLDDALRALRTADELAPDDPEVCFLLGTVALRAERLVEAENALARSVALAPHDPRSLAAHGLALRGLGRYEEAERALLRSLILRPADPGTLAALGEVYRLWGEPEKCAIRYEQAVWQIEREEGAVEGGDRERALAVARSRMEECEAAASARSDAPAPAPEGR